MYDPRGTHVVPGMTPEQARKAQRWDKPAIAVARLIIPYLILNTQNLGQTGEDILYGVYIAIWAFFLVEAIAIMRLSPSPLAYFRRNPLDVVIIVLSAPLPFLPGELDAIQVLWIFR